VLDLRGLTELSASVRQRIEALERALATVAAQAGQTAFAGGGGSTSSATTAALQTQITNLSVDLAALDARVLVLESATAASADGVLYDGDGRALLTGAGGAILIGP